MAQDKEYFVCEEDLQKHLSIHKVEILQSRHKVIYPGPIGDLECSISDCKRTIKATDPWDQHVKHIVEHVGQPADATINISEYRRLMITWALNENLMKGMDGRYMPTTLHDMQDLLHGPGETFNTCQSEENTSGGNDMSIIQRTEPSSAEYRQMPVTTGKSSSPHGGSSNGPNNQRGQGFDSSAPPLRRPFPPPAAMVGDITELAHLEPPLPCLFGFAGCTETFQQKAAWEKHIAIISAVHGHYYWVCREGLCENNEQTAYFDTEESFTKHRSLRHKSTLQCHYEHIYRPHPLDLECSACGETIVGTDAWYRRLQHVADHFTTTANDVNHGQLLTIWAWNENLMKCVGDNIYRATSRHDIKDSMIREQRWHALICQICDRRFEHKSLLERHELSHEKPFVCDVPGCPRTEGFNRAHDVDRHKRSKHPSAANNKRYRCYIQGCKSGHKSWTRPDNFRSHVKTVHKEFSKGELSKIVQRAEYVESEAHHALLPFSRVKEIIALDSDLNMCSDNAVFAITLATELFIQYLAQQGQSVVKSEQKPHQNIQYRDLSSAVAYHDNLKFLADVIPRTVPFKQVDGESKPGLARRPLIGAPC